MGTILIIDDNDTIREGLAHTVKKMGHTAVTAKSGAEGLGAFHARGARDLLVTDLQTEGVGVWSGAPSPSPPTPSAPGGVRHKAEPPPPPPPPRRARAKVEAQCDYLRAEAEHRYQFAELVGGSSGMQGIFSTIEKVAPTDSSVLISGESGTGKELVARAIHARSRRAQGPFIKVNCGALTETLPESELFGHEKGAFTGAIKRKLGRFELADQGTLFLDEIGDVTPAMQLKLLRALQEKEFERVGGEQTLKVDVRVVSATNKDLKQEVAAGRFREDLYYRLHIVPVTLPPLRDRKDDIPMLVAHFVEKLAPRTNAKVKGITDDGLGRLMAYPWPGNVRELENAIEQALVFAEGESIGISALPVFLRGDPAGDKLAVPHGDISLPDILDDLEKQLILKAYEKAKGVKTETARLLGIKTSALYYKLEKYGID